MMSRLPAEKRGIVDEIIEKADLKEVDVMVSNLAIAMEELQRNAEEKGIEKGKIEEKIEIAREALINGAGIDFVAKITKLDINTVNQISDNLKKEKE